MKKEDRDKLAKIAEDYTDRVDKYDDIQNTIFDLTSIHDGISAQEVCSIDTPDECYAIPGRRRHSITEGILEVLRKEINKLKKEQEAL
jgi:hypothetical protein